MTRLVSFDVWGTLLRANAQYRDAQRELLRDALGYPGDLDGLRAAIRQVYITLDRETESKGTQFGMVDRVSRLADLVGLPIPSPEVLMALKSSLTEVQLQHMPHLTEDTLSETFESLSMAGIEIAVISNTNMTDGTVVHEALAHHGLAHYVRYEVYSDQLGFGKPDPRIFAHLTQLSGVDPACTVHVGDNAITDMWGAKTFGFGALLYDRRHRHPRSTHVIWSHTELPERLT